MHEGNLLVVSRCKLANHSLVREDGKARRKVVQATQEADRGEAGEEAELYVLGPCHPDRPTRKADGPLDSLLNLASRSVSSPCPA